MTTSQSLEQRMQEAVGLHQAGRLAEAISIYESVVQQTPQAAGAFNLLGLAQFQLGNLSQAAAALGRAVALDPRLPNGNYNLARALQGAGRYQEALGHYQKALANAPGDAEILNNLGTVLSALDRLADAAQAYRQATALKPDYAQAWLNLGNVSGKLGNYAEAVPMYRQAVALRPDYAEAWLNLADTLSKLTEYAASDAAFVRLLALWPDHADGMRLRGYVLNAMNRYAESIAQLERAIAIDPNAPAAHYNLGVALAAVGRDDEAVASYERALALRPDYQRPRWGQCVLHLSRGRFAQGWAFYDSRWEGADQAALRRPYGQPRWSGERVAGTLLIWAEQGLGDQVMLGSMVGGLHGRADRVVLEVDARLVTLLARSLPGIEVVPQLEMLYSGAIAAQAPLGDLGRYLRPDAASFRRTADGYLAIDRARAEELRRRLSPDGRPVIGLSWISKNRLAGAAKSARLEDLLPLLRLPDCRFVDLQYGDTDAERSEMRDTHGIMVERLADIDNKNDIDGLTALIAACDVVVTVSNTTAHLAGAQGKPTWILAPYVHGRFWYWLNSGRDTPFYRSVRLCRLQQDQQWAGLMAAHVPEIVEFLGR